MKNEDFRKEYQVVDKDIKNIVKKNLQLSPSEIKKVLRKNYPSIKNEDIEKIIYELHDVILEKSKKDNKRKNKKIEEEREDR